MRLLLASSFEIIDLKLNAVRSFLNVKTKNPYFMKFLKIRISLNDETKKQKKLKCSCEATQKTIQKIGNLKFY